ncbi:conjugative transfer protein MobI(A/C) [Stutzerimonas kunmingensis]|uniref:conjugative transfer protein MobI(A/C) n=1 Tax=Stutzerimonas kunmingensis TaxID=1211807 RepID=UPI0028AAB8B8|nr:conjugative transfer protein MobI(A/C) [Stutzerimonas kunmingensis]
MYHEEGLDYFDKLDEELRSFRWQVEFALADPVPKMFHQELPFNYLVVMSYPLIRMWLDLLAAVIQAQAVDVRQAYRQARTEYQKEHRKGRAWVHDVRIKSTPNGASIEWLRYTGKYGDIHFSQGIRSEGLVRVPARNFKTCSATEKKAISVAEDRFSRLRHATMWLSTLAKALNALHQLRVTGNSEEPACESEPVE